MNPIHPSRSPLPNQLRQPLNAPDVVERTPSAPPRRHRVLSNCTLTEIRTRGSAAGSSYCGQPVRQVRSTGQQHQVCFTDCLQRLLRRDPDDSQRMTLRRPRHDRRSLDRERRTLEVDVVNPVAIHEPPARRVADDRVVLPRIPEPLADIHDVPGLAPSLGSRSRRDDARPPPPPRPRKTRRRSTRPARTRCGQESPPMPANETARCESPKASESTRSDPSPAPPEPRDR